VRVPTPDPEQIPRRVLVTGGLGFIGRALLERYRELGAEVRGVDRTADPSLGVVAGDVRDPVAWRGHAEGCDLVIHTAATVSMAAGDDGFWDVNVLGTRHVLESAARAGAERFVHLSSVVVFGFEFPDGVDETHPVRCNGVPYVDTKVASEQVVLQAHAAGEIAATIVRPGDVYGPGSQPWTMLPVELLKAGRFMLPAFGRGIFSPVYVDDLIAGIARAAGAPAASGRVLTLSGGAGVEAGEFFDHYARMLGKRRAPRVPTALALPAAAAIDRVARLRGVPNEVNANTVRYLCRRGTYSIARARELIGFEPAVELDDGMARSEAWLRERGLL
jgi:nucleoside-diphosphate-sugar epimerase